MVMNGGTGNTRHILASMSRIGVLASRVIVKKLKEHGIEGLVSSHGDILVQLYAHQEMSMKDLAAKIGKRKSTVTALIDKLVRSGYVEKSTDIYDHRIHIITLTRKAKNLEKDFQEISEELLFMTYKGFSEKEKIEVTNYLDRISDNLN